MNGRMGEVIENVLCYGGGGVCLQPKKDKKQSKIQNLI